MSRRNFSILLIGVLISALCYGRAERNPYARYVTYGFRTIDELALDQPPDKELLAGAMSGMLGVLKDRGDRNVAYLSWTEAAPLRVEMQQEFGGIGVPIGLRGEPARLTVVGPPEPGSPAAQSNVRAGDTILAIDGEPSDGKQLEELLSMMRGSVGEPIELTLLHPGEAEPKRVPLVRQKILLPSLLGDERAPDGAWRYLLEDAPRIAYVRVGWFGGKTVDELGALLPKLKQQGMQALVLDLRDNPGGALDAAVAVCDMFLPSGAPIVDIRSRHGELQAREVASGWGDYLELPIAVLINGQSASAAEIVAACLQDDDRAVIIGQRSYGKGTVQTLFPMEANKSDLKLTTASYWRPSGVNIHRLPEATVDDDWGVRPNAGFEIVMTPEEQLARLESRALRDGVLLDRPEALDEPAQGKPTPGAEPEQQTELQTQQWQDEALRLAVERLQSVLDN